MKFVYTFLLVLLNGMLLAQNDSAFIESPLVLHTATGDILGTLTLPKGTKKVPVALIHAGSGPTDRNGNNPSMQNNSLKLLAQELAVAGIASVRFDKRGIAASREAAKNEADMRFEDYVQDAKDWLALLRKDPRFSKNILIGHSEGSLIGMLAAAGNADAFVSIAGPGRPAATVLKEQFAAQPAQIKEAAMPVLDSLQAGKTVTGMPAFLRGIFRPSVQPYMISWFRYDPANELARLNLPILIIQGTSDVQVTEADGNLLAKANPKAKLVVIPHMNHILKTYEGSNRMENLATYNKADLPLHPGLMKALLSFLK